MSEISGPRDHSVLSAVEQALLPYCGAYAQFAAIAAVISLASRVASDARKDEMESRLRIWRDDYKRSDDGMYVAIPVHQLIELVGNPPSSIPSDASEGT